MNAEQSLVAKMRDSLIQYRELQMAAEDFDGGWATTELINRANELIIDDSARSSQYVSGEFADLVDAYNRGEQIQVKNKHTGKWINLGEPSWNSPVECYRVQPQEENQ